MMQLWLDFQRIDSIPQLREAFASRDAEGQRVLFGQLWRKHAAGLFLPWLARCVEARARQGTIESGRNAVEGAVNLESARRRLEDVGTDSSTEEIRNALAEICGIDAAAIPAETLRGNSATATRNEGADDTLIALLERQQWYRDDKRLRDFIATLPPDCIATDTDSLKKVLRRLAKRQDVQMADIYLFEIEGRSIFLRNVDDLRHIRLVGFGKPVLHFSSRDYDKTLDMNAADVKFEGLSIDRQDVHVVNGVERCTDVEWTEE